MKIVQPTARHKDAREAMIDALRQFGDDLSGMEMLAITSYFLGQLVALQDQRTTTPSMAMELISRNIEAGNQSAIDDLMATKGLS